MHNTSEFYSFTPRTIILSRIFRSRPRSRSYLRRARGETGNYAQTPEFEEESVVLRGERRTRVRRVTKTAVE